MIGAGPAGCACALSFARRGARVVVLEAERAAPRRLAGEWIHPAGVQVLRRMGVDLCREAHGSLGQGFIVHPGDGSRPIALPYPEGGALSLSHANLTEALRRIVDQRPGIELITGARVRKVGPFGRVHTSNRTFRGSLIIGADGRSSVIRAFLTRGSQDPSGKVTLSHLAGLTLEGALLPTERYGHIMLGGLGPALAYRLDEHTVRLCLDVPRTRPRARDLHAYLWDRYADALPASLQQPMATQLQMGRVQWAANHFRRRTFYGREGYALVGDAVGHAHPLVASGLTTAFLDAESLARSANVATYARERTSQCWTSDRLGAGIYRLFSEDTPTTRALRQAVFGLWRTETHRRDRSLRLLAMTESRKHILAAAFLNVVGQALSSRTRHAVVTGRWGELPQEITGFLSWLGWLGGPNHGIPPVRKAVTL
ncbi:MAG: FAD-dependent oxidoreductase [Vicinamibacteraceae bacterium]